MWCGIRSRWRSRIWKGDPDATLKAASWIQLDVAKKLFAAAGKNADEMIVAAGKPGFHSFELPVRLKAHVAEPGAAL